MTGILTIGWTGARETHGCANLVDKLSALAAAVLITLSTATTVLEQSALSSEPAGPGRAAPAPVRARFPRGRPWSAPTAARPTPIRARCAFTKRVREDFTIDPVHWHAEPFHNPIYYGARVAQWFTGGKTGMMVDFIHSKAMADLDEEASFSGQIDGKPLPAARAHQGHREEARVLRTATTCCCSPACCGCLRSARG